jgi:hypothetical protein
MVAAFSVPGRIEEEFPIAKRRKEKEETVSRKELENFRLCLWRILSNVFFLETWKLEAVGFIEVYLALPISLLFQNRWF